MTRSQIERRVLLGSRLRLDLGFIKQMTMIIDYDNLESNWTKSTCGFQTKVGFGYHLAIDYDY